ncbi:MAG TPA: helix-turn-helix domain-containing protein [Steroidobacteraceae bacterium]
MRQRTTVTMSMRELDRLKCIQAVIDGEISATRAAERLALSARQVRRLAQRYRREGPVGLISRHRHRPSNRRLKEDLENQVARILRESYPDFGPTLAMEKLAQRQRLKTIQAVIDGELYSYKAAERLGISARQLRRLAERYRAQGPTGLISRRCGRPSNNRLEAHLEQQIVNILRESYWLPCAAQPSVSIGLPS